MSARLLRLLAALPRRLPNLSRPRQLAWGLRLMAVCLARAAARRLSLAAGRLMRGTRHRLVGIRRIWLSPDTLAVVVLARRPPRFAFRIRCLTLDPQFFKSGLR